LARATRKDIEKAATAVQPAVRPRIHTFIATSPVHRRSKLRMSREDVLERIRTMVALAREQCDDVEFSPEDGGRTEPEFLWEAVSAAIAAGATTINIPDTVGYTQPSEFGQLIAGVVQNASGADGVIISVHCHNDLGLATANTLAGLQAGARQAEVTVNGIGERAGNTALEECVLALRTRQDVYGLETGIDATQIARVSAMVSRITGMPVQPNKAIVGANAFAHEAGIHQDGMLKDETTYEIIRPVDVGVEESLLVLGKHSGRHAFATRLGTLGYEVAGETLDRLFARFKGVAERKKTIHDADLLELVEGEVGPASVSYSLNHVTVSCGTGVRTATVGLRGADGADHVQAAVGSGPVEAVFRAIDAIVQVDCRLLDYQLHANSEGKNALGEAQVKIKPADEDFERAHPQLESPRTRVFHGHAASTDVLEASAMAYVAAINQLIAAAERHRAWNPELVDDDATRESEKRQSVS
jgi:2-isopropylmalate synthase